MNWIRRSNIKAFSFHMEEALTDDCGANIGCAIITKFWNNFGLNRPLPILQIKSVFACDLQSIDCFGLHNIGLN